MPRFARAANGPIPVARGSCHTHTQPLVLQLWARAVLQPDQFLQLQRRGHGSTPARVPGAGGRPSALRAGPRAVPHPGAPQLRDPDVPSDPCLSAQCVCPQSLPPALVLVSQGPSYVVMCRVLHAPGATCAAVASSGSGAERQVRPRPRARTSTTRRRRARRELSSPAAHPWPLAGSWASCSVGHFLA